MIKNLKILTAVVIAMVVIESLKLPFTLVWATFDLDGLLRTVGGTSGLSAISYVSLALTVIPFAVWIYIAGKNVENAGLNLKFTPASRIWWFAVPIAFFYKPFQGMRELWNASHGAAHYDTNHPLISFWWAFYLFCDLPGYLLGALARNGGGTWPLWVLSVLMIARAVFAIMLVRGIAVAQGRSLTGEQLQEVFA